MSDFGPTGPLLVDAAGLITGDVPCRKCGYDLRGLNQMGLCPECGTPVGLSVNGDLLRYSDPAWLARVVQGIGLILWGILVSIVLSIVGALFARLSPIAPQLLVTIGSIMGFVGTWMMTSPDPSGIGEDGKLRARQIVRIAVAAAFASQLMQLLSTIVSRTIDIHLAVTILAIPLGIVAVIRRVRQADLYRQSGEPNTRLQFGKER